MQSLSPCPRTEEDVPTRKRKLPTRQVLVCTLCRERKVKCDRTKPCFACCARGDPNACHFVVNEGSDYEPIKQSYTIRNLRREVEALKEQLRDALEAGRYRGSYQGQEAAPKEISSCIVEPKRRRLTATQPSAPNHNRTHIAMRTPFVGQPSIHYQLRHMEQPVTYPFPALPIGDNTTAALTSLLPAKNEIFAGLEIFHGIAQSFAVPQAPEKTRKKEMEHFLSDIERNAMKAPDTLGLLFAALALVLHMSTFGRRRNWSIAKGEAAFTRGECYIAASMQALRNASFMSEPTLVGIKTLLILGADLTRTGRAQNASALFGTTVQLAYSLDLHRDPHTFTPRLTPTECQTRRSLWWLMLHSDQHLAHMLSSPLTISSIGDCPPPLSLSSNPLEPRVAYVVHELTLFARKISTPRRIMTANDARKKLSRLEDLWQSMPETLRLDADWSRSKLHLPDWPFEIISASMSPLIGVRYVATLSDEVSGIFADMQYMIILLNDLSSATTSNSESSDPLRTEEDQPIGRIPRGSTTLQPPTVSRRTPIASACINLLHAFLFLWNCSSNVQVSHPVESRAITAVTILLTFGQRAGCQVGMSLIDEVYCVFLEMQRSGVSRIAAFAVDQISRLRTQH